MMFSSLSLVSFHAFLTEKRLVGNDPPIRLGIRVEHGADFDKVRFAKVLKVLYANRQFSCVHRASLAQTPLADYGSGVRLKQLRRVLAHKRADRLCVVQGAEHIVLVKRHFRRVTRLYAVLGESGTDVSDLRKQRLDGFTPLAKLIKLVNTRRCFAVKYQKPFKIFFNCLLAMKADYFKRGGPHIVCIVFGNP
jgi:hypothetical protein